LISGKPEPSETLDFCYRRRHLETTRDRAVGGGYDAWNIVLTFLDADAHVPKEVKLPNSAHREVARQLQQRRDFPVVEVIDALKVLAQPELLQTAPREAGLQTLAPGDDLANMVVAPLPREIRSAPKRR
jgi:hypothetical protein